MTALVSFYKSMQSSLLALLLSLLVAAVIVSLVGENPMVLWEAAGNTLGTGFGWGYALYYATPLIFTGLSVAVSFHCGLFNIGAEGQLYVGAVAMIFLVTVCPWLPAGIAVLFALIAAGLGGGLWGFIAGWLKAKRGSHEVIVTILLNFIAYAIADYSILYVFKDPTDPNPVTVTVPRSFEIPSLDHLLQGVLGSFFRSTPANATLFLALFSALIVHYFLFHTTWGYELRVVGKAPRAGRFSGIHVNRSVILAFGLSGMLAGLVALNEVLGYHHRLIQGFSPGYGFTGIAVALLARNHPIAIVLSAFLFGVIQNSARELEFLSDSVTKELSLVLQGVLVALIACDYLIGAWLKKRSRRA